MASSNKSLWWFLAGLVLGGVIGVVGGYVINDLTSRENPEVVKEMQEEKQRQEDIDNLLDQLGSQGPAGGTDTTSATGESDTQPGAESASDAQ